MLKMMDVITVLAVELNAARRARLAESLSREPDFVVTCVGHDFTAQEPVSLPISRCDVIVLDADQIAVTQIRTWAILHVLLPDARVLAMTEGRDDRVLEAVLAAGVTGLLRPGIERVRLCRAVRNAAQGITDFDPNLVERAKRVVLQPVAETQARFGGLTIDFQTHDVTRWGSCIHLTPLEFKVIAYLARHADRSVCLTELLAAVWAASPNQGGTLAQVHNCIKRIRQKIEPDVKHPRYLMSIRGLGYQLHDPTVDRLASSLAPYMEHLRPDFVLPQVDTFAKLIDD